MNIGQWNQMQVIKAVDFGVYLNGEELGEILLPQRYVPVSCEVGDELEVFLAYDSEDRLIATTDKPLAQVGRYAVLQVAALLDIGAFLSWGLPKDLFLPFAEQTRELKVGQLVIVYVYLDKSQRLAASMRLTRFKSDEPMDYEVGQQVDLIIAARTDLGYKAIINHKHWGMIFENEVFQTLNYADQIKGYVSRVREDKKIDLVLQPLGYTGVDDIAAHILQKLKANAGFLPIHDKTPADVIYTYFQVSKKKYKMALGGLYKKRQIRVSEEGVYLIE